MLRSWAIHRLHRLRSLTVLLMLAFPVLLAAPAVPAPVPCDSYHAMDVLAETLGAPCPADMAAAVCCHAASCATVAMTLPAVPICPVPWPGPAAPASTGLGAGGPGIASPPIVPPPRAS